MSDSPVSAAAPNHPRSRRSWAMIACGFSAGMFLVLTLLAALARSKLGSLEHASTAEGNEPDIWAYPLMVSLSPFRFLCSRLEVARTLTCLSECRSRDSLCDSRGLLDRPLHLLLRPGSPPAPHEMDVDRDDRFFRRRACAMGGCRCDHVLRINKVSDPESMVSKASGDPCWVSVED